MIQFPAGIDATLFLRDYWQQRPLLIPQGLPGFQSPLDGDELAGLSLDEDVESRLIMETGFESPWELHQGPFPETFYSQLPAAPWTLLVQALDLWVPGVDALIDHFNFLPRWRIDDIMASYATRGGSVGPHFDYYDVFLIQGQGSRHWAIGELCDQHTPLLTGTPLKILQDFRSSQHWVLNPGDILYLPPCIAHHGIAEDDGCITYSVGFRSPTAGELLDDLATEVISRGGGSYFRDPPLTPDMATDSIHPAFIGQVQQLLLDTLNDSSQLEAWFASYMTRCKYPHLENDPDLPPRRARLQGDTGASDRLFVNGFEVTEDPAE